MHRWRSILVSFALAATLSGLILAPVSATYPGQHNGRIAFAIRAADGSANIFSVLPNGNGLKQLTTGSGNHLCPAWSADGQTIAYCADASDGSGAFEIWTMHSDGTSQRQLTHLGGFAVFPDIAPDGSKVVFAGYQGDFSHSEIYVVDAQSGEGLRALTSCAGLANGCYNDLPVWSPDGSRIAFIHGDDFDEDTGNPVNSQVWVMDADGGHPHPLTSDSALKDQVPDWSPDGSKIAYNAGAYGSGGIWSMDADGSHHQQLTGCVAADPEPCAQGDDWGVSWSPDGKKIAFLRDYNSIGIKDRPVFVMDADGSHQQRLTDGTENHAVPAWQPKGVGH